MYAHTYMENRKRKYYFLKLLAYLVIQYSLSCEAIFPHLQYSYPLAYTLFMSDRFSKGNGLNK